MTEPTLAGRNVLILGASSGIGRSVALSAAASGASIVVVGRRGHLLDEVIATAENGTAIVADLSDPAECARVSAEAVTALGGHVDAVLHATGWSPLMPIARTEPDTWQTVMLTNVIAPSLITKAVLPALTEDGIVAFVSSRAVGRPYHGVGAYAASKAALDQTLLSWRLENPDRRFLRIEVGDTDNTDFARDFDLTLVAELFPQWVAHAALAQRRMTAEDLGAFIAKAIAQGLAHPGIGLHNLVLHPVGGPYTGDGQQVAAELGAELREQRAVAE
ncbi:MAG TPA: SDR family oxidoreductase [Pseudonocardiaceae bacterium]|jgi:NAD(P)-dependent dehydrogenase (short-subunit alcohol dehydrogenase family)